MNLKKVIDASKVPEEYFNHLINSRSMDSLDRKSAYYDFSFDEIVALISGADWDYCGECHSVQFGDGTGDIVKQYRSNIGGYRSLVLLDDLELYEELTLVESHIGDWCHSVGTHMKFDHEYFNFSTLLTLEITPELEVVFDFYPGDLIYDSELLSTFNEDYKVNDRITVEKAKDYGLKYALLL